MINAGDCLVTFNKGKDPEISFYETIPWKVNEYRDVEFFPGKVTRVFLISNEYEDMSNILQQLETDKDDDHKSIDKYDMIAIDLEWEIDKLCLIQFCSNNICLVIRLFTEEDLPIFDEDLVQKNNDILKNFLNTHKFYGKGMRNDEKMLFSFFGKTFSENFEDIEKTRLLPNDLSLNFNKMTKLFAGEPTASFKVIEMTKSDWSVPELNFRQVLYSAFDTVALYYCYPHFPQMKENKTKQKNKTEKQKQKQKSKTKQNVKYYKLDKKGPKMNLSVVFKEKVKKETFSYLITNYKGTKNKILLKSLWNEIDFISSFDTGSTSYLFISSFVPINDFSKLFPQKNFENVNYIKNQKSIEITDPEEALSCRGIEKIIDDVFYLPKVPFSLCNDTDVLFVTNLPTSIFSEEEKLQEFFYCFGFDQIVSRIDDKNLNSCIVEPRNLEISKRIRTFLPFITIDNCHLNLYEYPSFLRTIRLSNIPYNFTENDLKKLFIHKGKAIAESCEFILKRIESDSQTAYVMFNTLQDKQIFSSKFNHFKIKDLKKIFDFNLNDDDDELLVIPFSSDVHYRYLRSFEINVYLKNHSQLTFDDIYASFSKFGKILQMNYDKRFNNYHIQYYRKCDAVKAYEYYMSLNQIDEINCSQNKLNDKSFANKIVVEMHPEGSTITIRDLPLEIKEEELITVFSKLGRITNLVFRDLTPMNMLSIVDIYFSSSDEAKEIKKVMNKTKIGGTSIHISIRSREDLTSSKMSQRNQWVVFDENYKTIEDVFAQTARFGKIIDYCFSNNHFLAMFDNQENAKNAIDELNLSNPTYHQFVEETNNSNDLTIVQKPSISGNPAEQQEAAIVVDPISDSLTEDFIEKIISEGTPNSADEASILVSASSLMLPSSKDFKSIRSDVNKCQYQHELFITNSIKFEGKKRLIIYTPSNNVTKKLFTLIKNSKFDGEYFKPKKIDVQDLENPPQRKIKKNMFEGHEIINPVVAIDPLPNQLNDEEIKDTFKDIADLKIVICKSSKIKGKMRAILIPQIKSQKRIIRKTLSRKIIDNENLHLFEYKCDSIPPPL